MPIMCCGCQRADRIRMYECGCTCHSNNCFPEFGGTLPGMVGARDHSPTAPNILPISVSPLSTVYPNSPRPYHFVNHEQSPYVPDAPTYPRFRSNTESPFVQYPSASQISRRSPSPHPVIVPNNSIPTQLSLSSSAMSNSSIVQLESPFSVVSSSPMSPPNNIAASQRFPRSRHFDDF